MIDARTQKSLNRLELRGMKVSTDPEFLKMAPWVRVTCAFCVTFVAIGTIFAFTPLLWTMVVVAGIGAITPRHPFDAVYNYGIRRWTGTRPLPKNSAPARFASGFGATWIAAVAVAFDTGNTTLATILGFAFVAAASHVVVTQLCPPSMLYQFLFGDRRLIKPAIFGSPA